MCNKDPPTTYGLRFSDHESACFLALKKLLSIFPFNVAVIPAAII